MWWSESTFAWTFNGRVLDIGTGRGLQNLDNVGSIPTSLSKWLVHLSSLQDGSGNSMTNVLTLVRSKTIGKNGSIPPRNISWILPSFSICATKKTHFTQEDRVTINDG